MYIKKEKGVNNENKKLFSVVLIISMLASMFTGVSIAAAAGTTENSAFVDNSTQVAVETFTYADKVETNIREAGIPTIARHNASNDYGSTAYIAADPDDATNYVLQVNKEAFTKGNPPSATNEVEKTFSANCDSEYIVYSQRMKLISTQTTRMRLRLAYKEKLNGGVNPEGDITNSSDSQASPNLSMYFNGDGLVNETASNTKMGVAADACLNKWVTLTLLIDAFDWSFDAYVDDTYYYTGSFANVAVSTDDYYISGIWKSEVGFDRWANANTSAYFDDFAVRSMSTAQAAQLEKDMITIPEAIEAGSLIVATTPITKQAITWTTSEANVTVTNGVVAIIDASKGTKYEDVTFTASFGGTTATFTADVTAVPKYAEYKIGADADLAYGMTSYNITYGSNLYTQTRDGLTVRNPIVDYGEEKTFYFVSDNSNGSNSVEVTKEEYDASTAVSKKSYTNRYRNTSSVTKEDAHNRYAAIGPDGDKRDALMGVPHIRNIGDLNKKLTYAMLSFDAGETFADTDNALTIEIDVLDIGSGNLSIRYWSLTGLKVATSNETLGDTGAWKTFTFTLTDADFSNTNGSSGDGASTGLGDKKQDFRIECKALVYLSAVRVYNVAKKDLAQSDYTTVTLADYDVVITADGGVQAKEAITADEAADAKLYVAYYNKNGNLVDVAVSNQVTNGVAATIKTGVTTERFIPGEHTIKTFLWDADLKPYR